ncbi:hypothetical protein P43SY_001312 [Pythium insidiosum]|uniref:Amino acid transporter transmembrane domain-containing protein n=1 Tax=Pythium insidiosum TaxID=114742 RepID=A0AAD5LHS3_PYTIN|nr:hypothetical protein P43SY_001312 [Pythium insidiosum]
MSSSVGGASFPRVTKVEELNDQRAVKITWEDDFSAKFHKKWLRDHCKCPQCQHPETLQRQVDTASIPHDPSITTLAVNQSRDGVSIAWNSSVKGSPCRASDFDAQWLRSHAYSVEPNPYPINHRQETLNGKFLWDQSATIPRHAFADSMADLKPVMQDLHKYGIVMVHSTPSSMEETEQFSRKIGFVMETIYGKMWTTNPQTEDQQYNDTASSNIELLHHTDGTYIRDPPGLQIFNCIVQAGEGGDSRYVDAFHVVEKLRRQFPSAFEFFSKTPLHYQTYDEDAHLTTMEPIIKLDHAGNVVQFRHNDYDRAPLTHLSFEQVDEFYRHHTELLKIIRDPAMEFRHKLQVGEMVIVDNHRSLHVLRLGFALGRVQCFFNNAANGYGGYASQQPRAPHYPPYPAPPLPPYPAPHPGPYGYAPPPTMMPMHEGSKLLHTHVAPQSEGSSARHVPEGSALSSYLGLATTMMGAVILTLPGTLEAAGIIPGMLIFLGAGWLTYQSFEMICVACDATGEYSYEALSSRLFGAAGVWLVRALTLVLLFGSVVTYMVIAMDLFEPFLTGVMARNTIGLAFTVVAIPLCLPETIYELRHANLMVIVCILYILVALAIRCVEKDPQLIANLQVNEDNQFKSEAAAIAYVLPIITLSYACQLNVPRAYEEIGDRRTMRRVNVALVATGMVSYMSFAFLGYLCFQGHPPSDILTGFGADDTLINGARLCLGISMVLKTPMTFQPLRQAVELVALGHSRESLPFRAAITVFFMFFAHLLSISSRDLGVVMSFIGAVAGNVLMITIPGLFLYKISKGYYVVDARAMIAPFSRRWSVLVAAAGVSVSVVSLIYLTYATFFGAEQ